MVKKVYGKRGESIRFFLFPYTFFPIFSHGENGVGPPPPQAALYNRQVHIKYPLDEHESVK